MKHSEDNDEAERAWEIGAPEEKRKMNIIELYDKLATKFHDETGIMAPGKDDVLGQHSFGVRFAEWNKWLEDISYSQRERMNHAINAVIEGMAMCTVPYGLRSGEVAKVRMELLVKMKIDGEMYPESETETKWRNRELKHWEYPLRHHLKDNEF